MGEFVFLAAYYSLLVALIVLIGLIIRIEYKTQNIALLFWITILVAYVFSSLSDPFNKTATINADSEVMNLSNNAVLLKAHLFAFGFSAVYFVTRLLSYNAERTLYPQDTPRNFPVMLRDDWRTRSLLFIILIVSVAAVLSGVYAIVSTQGWSGLFQGTYTSYRLGANSVFKLLSYYLIVSISAGVFMAWYTKRRLLSLFLLLSIAVVFLLGRTRQLLLPMMMPFAVYFIYKYRGFLGRTQLLLSIVFLYFFIFFLQFFRYQGGLFDGLAAMTTAEFYGQFFDNVLQGKGEALIRFAYYYFLQADLNFDGFMTGQTYRRLVLLPIPYSYSLGLKPRDFDEVLYNVYYHFPEGDVFGTLHILMFGNAYTNFGWFGVGLGAFWAFFFYMVNRLLSTRSASFRIMLIAPMGMAAVMLARGSIYNSSAVAFWTSLLTILWYTTAHIRLRKRISPPEDHSARPAGNLQLSPSQVDL